MGDALTPGTFWGGFTRDPRDPGVAGLRMSDRDRAHLLDALGEAYADGRLDDVEHDERVGAAQSVKTFGQVPALITDLVPTTDVVRWASPDDLRRRAEEAWRRDLRSALRVFGGVSALVVVIWVTVFVGSGGQAIFFWPAFPIFFTGANAAQAWFKREEIVERRQRKLQRAQDREQRRLGRGDS
ncbi:MAG: DUF1707 domain-containing protein [Nocardioidaceae bacterium]|nr:DUF1707 domain-containing protein [Nocardioidaceae bacterium]